ncbi:MAG: tRNA pseudouridine(38-40) synthase TruA [Oligoflexia bacterium]|nr:tRNA pseudouridine(38-40) synthase TruA [Oligoflexia bacterium]
MTIYRAVISYKGTDYFGWQVQPDQITIQGELNNALSKICKCELNEIKTLGSGRTDAGVHALGQVVKIEIPLNLPAEGLMNALNSFLSKNIRVREVTPSTSEFHPTMDAKDKTYHYYFTYGDDLRSPFSNDIVAHFKGEVDLDLLKKACKFFEGTHDFQNFRTVGTDVKTTERTIHEITLTECVDNKITSEQIYCLSFKGSGFLKQMVRLLVGTIISYGQQRITEAQIKQYLSESKEDKLAPVAPAEGLFLMNVNYN